ncbi:MAG: hypothetical protein M1830_008476 [Pleopsidium flavum]|nr:MAG: hypothetical protein M1830_008476 [Pleopsidium flavum]
MAFAPTSQQGILHHYSARLVAFEHTRTTPTAASAPKDTLLFIAGLTDGLLTVPYSTLLAQALPPSYTLTQVLLSSSYLGWGTSSLGKDCAEIAQCVAYLKEKKPGGKVVLMGHSTGCQDAMHYLVGPDAKARPPIEGAIIQASVSDREAMVELLPVYEESVKAAKDLVRAGQAEELLPFSVTGGFLGTPICARRWLSLASPEKDGEDDYFSSDLEDEQLQNTFGRLPARSPLCILYSESDEYVPEFVDREAVVNRWMEFVRLGVGVVDEKHSGLLKDATHSLNGNPAEVVQDLIKRVVGFLQRLENGELERGSKALNNQPSL